MPLPVLHHASAFHSRAIPLEDFGSVDLHNRESSLPAPQDFVRASLKSKTQSVKAWRGVECTRMNDDDCGGVASAILAACGGDGGGNGNGGDGNGFQVSALSLRNHRIGDAGAAKLGELLKKYDGRNVVGLQGLDLMGNVIGAKGCAALCEALKSNDTVTSLNLSFNSLGREGGYALAEMLELNGSLVVLDCGHCDLTTDNVVALMSVLRANELIASLSIQNCRTFSRAEDIAKHTTRMLDFNRNLVTLNFDRNHVGDEGAILFASVLENKNKSLRNLHLSGNKIGVTGAEALASLLIRGKCGLLTLDLSSNRICDDGAVAFGAALRANKVLRTLNLKCCGAGDGGLTDIAMGMHENSTLSELLLWGNDFGQQSCGEFMQLVEGRFNYFGVAVDFLPYIVDGVYQVAEVQGGGGGERK